MCYHVGHLDVEQSVGAQVLEDVGQSSGVALLPSQGADPSGVMLVHHALEDSNRQRSASQQRYTSSDSNFYDYL